MWEYQHLPPDEHDRDDDLHPGNLWCLPLPLSPWYETQSGPDFSNFMKYQNYKLSSHAIKTFISVILHKSF